LGTHADHDDNNPDLLTLHGAFRDGNLVVGLCSLSAAGVALVAEVMPDRARPYCLGFLQGFSALGHVAGSLLSLAIGPQSEISGVAGWRWLFLAGVAQSLLALIVRWRLNEPESWVRAGEVAKRSKAGNQDFSTTGSPDELHKQLGDLGEIFRSRQLLRNVVIGMSLGVCGQICLWSIGYWTPELIRGAQLEQRREAAEATSRASQSALARNVAPNLRELAEQVAGNERETIELESRWRRSDDQLVAWGTVLQDTAGMCGIYAFTFLTARTCRRVAFAVSYLIAFAATVFTFSSMRTASDVLWMAPLLGFCISSVYGGFAIYFPELFPTRLRSTGTGLCYNVARYITAFGPLLLGKLTAAFAHSGAGLPLRWAAVSLATIYLVGLIAVKFAPETHGKPLPE